MSRLTDGHNVQELERSLQGLQFPALKHDVILTARRQGAPDEVIAMLESLPKTTFESLRDVINVYGTA